MKTKDVAPELRPFWKIFEPLAYRHDASRVFDDFLTIALTQFAEPGNEQMVQLNNDARLRYKPEERQQFTLLFQEMIRTVHRHLGDDTSAQLQEEARQKLLHQDVPARKGRAMDWYDFFGDFYMELASRHKASALGQFFTPVPICKMMAAMTIAAPDDEGKELPKRFTANEPCAGSGRMVLAMNSQRLGGFYVAQDLDFMCVKMTAINMLIHGVVGEVTHGNSLDPTDIRTTFAINTHLNKVLHPYRGIPHVFPLPKEESYLHRYWNGRLEAIEAEKAVKLLPAVPVAKPLLTLY